MSSNNATSNVVSVDEQAFEKADEAEVNEDGLEPIEGLPSVDDRVEQNPLDGARDDRRLASPWYVEEAIDIDNADEAAQYADLSNQEWQTTKETWADRYREQGVEAGVDELAKAHIRTRFDVDDFETFCEAVVEWPNERQQAVLEEALAGGLKMAEQGIRDVTDAVDSEDR